jgi:two-component system LytT family sensor kinase
MNKLRIENVLNQKKPVTHLGIMVFSATFIFLYLFLGNEEITWNAFFPGFILGTVQIEAFLFLGYILFRNFHPGVSPGEVTRNVSSRFFIFLLLGLIVAFVIIMCFNYIRQWFSGGELSEVAGNFFKYSFATWLKSTLTGLTIGTLIFIIILWQEALRREQKLREENLVFQNETLKNQVNPHFLFNSLNTLASLIDSDPDTSRFFIQKLSAIYRYILDNGNRDKVPLASELGFISDYFELHKIRGEGKIFMTIDIPDPGGSWILPVSLQILIENAIKHNMATKEKPLKITIYTDREYVVVSNNLQPMSAGLKSTLIGLKNLSERVRLTTGKTVGVEKSENEFTVKVPLLS